MNNMGLSTHGSTVRWDRGSKGWACRILVFVLVVTAPGAVNRITNPDNNRTLSRAEPAMNLQPATWVVVDIAVKLVQGDI